MMKAFSFNEVVVISTNYVLFHTFSVYEKRSSFKYVEKF